ncbi:MAG: hypothetical protein WD048_12345 [Chitinophagales bacterium]
MKKLFITSTLAFLIVMGFSSCRKCVVCNKDSEPEVRLCEGDYNSNTEYGATVDFYEARGFDCR